MVGFWSTVCKTIHPILSDRCLLSRHVLSVTLVYCGQISGWIKMKLATLLGLGPGHTVLDGDPAPPRKGEQQSLTFEIYGGRKLCLCPYNPRSMSTVAKRLDGSR